MNVFQSKFGAVEYSIFDCIHTIKAPEGTFKFVLPKEIDRPFFKWSNGRCLQCQTNLKTNNICQECKTTDSGKALLSIRRKISFLVNIGYSSNYSRPDVVSKREENMTNSYGVPNIFSSEEFQSTRAASMIERYGAEHSVHSDQLQAKRLATLQANYGVDHPMKSESIRNKKDSTMIEGYGNVHYLATKHGKDHVKSTNMIRFGSDVASKSDTVKNKIKKVLANLNYGTNSIDEFAAEFRLVFLEHGLITALERFPNVSRQIALRHFLTEDEKQQTASIIENDIRIYLENRLGIDLERGARKVIPGRPRLEVDIINKEHKISVEFNGTYWHKDSYERDIFKADALREIGYKHMSLDENDLDSLDKIADILSPSKIFIGARKLKIKEMPKASIQKFFQDNHLKGNIGFYKCFCLVNDADQIVQAMSIGKPRFNKEYDWEILRLATKRGIVVTGGSERIFASVRKSLFGKFISYSDNKYFDGSVYPKLGFKFDSNTKPNYRWCKGSQFLSRYQTQKHKLKELLGVIYDSEKTEDENMINAGWYKSFDLGQKKWILNSK